MGSNTGWAVQESTAADYGIVDTASRTRTLIEKCMCFRILVFIGIILSMGGCSTMAKSPPNPEPYTLDTPGGIRIHVVQTGWVAVKNSFRDLKGPAALRIPAIILDPTWTEWFPIQFFVIEHPEGVIVFDTGETSDVADESYFNCDSMTKWFYTTQMKFAVNPEDELIAQLGKLDISPQRVRWVVLSHLHSDHIGGLKDLSKSEVLVSRADSTGHQGALMCQFPTQITPTLVDYQDAPFGAFDRSYSVTRDQSVRIVPTPGHTNGHQSLLLKVVENNKELFYFFAGDVIFDVERLKDSKALAGIVENVSAAKESINQVKKQMLNFNTWIAPAHDHHVGSRAIDH